MHHTSATRSRFLRMVANGTSVREAARCLGVPDRTAKHWRSQSGRREIDEARRASAYRRHIIVALYNRGHTMQAIADEVGITWRAVAKAIAKARAQGKVHGWRRARSPSPANREATA